MSFFLLWYCNPILTSDHPYSPLLTLPRYALEPGQISPRTDQLPDGRLRFQTLAKHPVAAGNLNTVYSHSVEVLHVCFSAVILDVLCLALYFEKLYTAVVEIILGYSLKKKQPYKRDGTRRAI